MNFRYSNMALSCLVAVLIVPVFSISARAEGDEVCSGKATGKTESAAVNPNVNPNMGITYFDEGFSVNLSAAGIPGLGFAPDWKHAACVDTEYESYVSLGVDEHVLRGYAWNDNLGFISFYCNGPAGNKKNEGIACGTYDYAVKIGADAAGTRPLTGYAWNESLGYINFSCSGGLDGNGNACGPFNYGVTMNSATGDLSGYAFTESGVYMNVKGLKLALPGATVVKDNYCDGKPYVCVEVTPDPDNLNFDDLNIGASKGVKVADGQEFYQINLYLREADGVTKMNFANYDVNRFFDSLTFSWDDTVKLNQLAGNKADKFQSTNPSPWGSGVGGVIYKPVTQFKLTDFTEDPKEPGKYIMTKTIRSFAPTTNANVSYTTASQNPFVVENEQFWFDVGIGDIEANKLLLKNVSFDLRTSGGVVVDTPNVIYPNGKAGISLKFRPAIELNTLYADDLQDLIDGIRGVPISFSLASRSLGAISPSLATGADLELKLAYPVTEASVACIEEGAEVVNFNFHFLEDLTGKDVADGNVVRLTGKIGDVFKKVVNLQARADIPEGDSRPCSSMRGGTLFSEISYMSEGKKIAYYSNKLPRLPGDAIANPAAVIKGNVYAQSTYNPSGSVEIESVDVNIDTVRETIVENVKRYVGVVKLKDKGSCRITKLGDKSATVGVYGSGACDSSYYSNFKVGEGAGGENVLYFKGSNVSLELPTGEWVGKWVIIVDDGNLFIDKDLYNGPSAPDKRLSLVVLQKFGEAYGKGGNVYLNSLVKNVQATLIADGTVFSYTDKAKINSTTGEPMWNGFGEMVDALSTCQLLFEGSISSKNTIGGSEKTPFVLGTGEVLSDSSQKLRAQLHDMNYLRLRTPSIEISDEGLPIDQKCGKALTPDDYGMIVAGQTVCGELSDCDPAGDSYQRYACDGIDLDKYDEASGYGDLVVIDETCSSQGLDPELDLEPLYVKFVKPPESFLFADGAVTVSQ